MADISIDRRNDSLFNWGPDGLEMRSEAINPKIFSHSFLHEKRKQETELDYSSDQFVVMPEPSGRGKNQTPEAILTKPSLPPPEKEDKPIPRIIVTPPPQETEAAAEAIPNGKVLAEIKTTPQVQERKSEATASSTFQSLPPLAAEKELSSRLKKHKTPPLSVDIEKETYEMAGVNQIGTTWAKVIDSIFEARRQCQENSNDLLHTQIKKRKVLDAKVHENTRAKEEKKADGEKWEFYKDTLEFLTIAAALAGGIALQGIGVATNNSAAILAGGEMTLGGVLYFTSSSLKHIGLESSYSNLLAWAGAALIAHSFTKAGALLFHNAGQTMTTVTTSAVGLSKGLICANKERTRGGLEELNSDYAVAQKDRTKLDDDMKKTGSGHKLTGLSELAKAASAQEEERQRVISRIIEGNKA